MLTTYAIDSMLTTSAIDSMLTTSAIYFMLTTSAIDSMLTVLNPLLNKAGVLMTCPCACMGLMLQLLRLFQVCSFQ